MFGKKYVGLDIADRTIEIAEVETSGDKKQVLNLGRIFLDEGVVERGRIIDKSKLALALRTVFAKAKPNPVAFNNSIIFGLPESQVFSHTFFIPAGEKDIEDFIKKEIEETIPAPTEDLSYVYKVLAEKDDKIKVLLIVCLKEVLEEWRVFFASQNMDVEVFDTETLASFRDIFVEIPKQPVCLVDIGSIGTHVSIFDADGLYFSYLSDHGGRLFDTKISEKLDVDMATAENQKKEVGLSLPDSDIYNSLIGPVTGLAQDIKNNLHYFENLSLQTVEKIILLGGNSQIKELPAVLGGLIGLPVEIASAKSVKNNVPLEHIEAVGLAFYGLDKKWQKHDPVFHTKDIILSKSLSVKNSEEVVEKNTKEEIHGEVPQSNKGHKVFVEILVFLVLLLVIGAIFWWYFTIMK